jgi:cytoskeletal protein RodZ
MPQDLINLAISGVAAVIGWFLRVVWEQQQELRKETSDLAQKVNSIEVLVAGQYVRRDELGQALNRIDAKLDSIASKLDTKMDKAK